MHEESMQQKKKESQKEIIKRYQEYLIIITS